MNAFISPVFASNVSSISTAISPHRPIHYRTSSFIAPFMMTTFSPRPASPHSISMLAEQLTDASTTRKIQVAKLIQEGPVFKLAKLQLCTDDPSDYLPSCEPDEDSTLNTWMKMATVLEEALGEQSNDVRVYQYYLPIFFWILRELKIHTTNITEAAKADSNEPDHRPFILGFSCPQGGGKTTMTTFIQKLLGLKGHSVQIASLDDFYVTNAEQGVISSQYPGNKLMQYRGMPGTQDLDLLNETLDSLRGGHDVSIPRYDKTAFQGRGDRAPKEQWKHINESTDVVLLEGWCMGFEPVENDSLIDPNLAVVNEALHDFMGMYKRLDGMLIIEISNMEWVYGWRMQAERATRAAGRPGLTDEQVTDFVSRFMPAYKQYSTPLYKRATPLIPKHELHIEIDEERRPVHRERS